MIALLRYLVMKSMRDNTLAALISAPLVMVIAPLLVVWLFQTLSGGWSFPLVIDSRVTPVESGAVMLEVITHLSILASGLSGFWVLRGEIANASIGSFLLASRGRSMAAAATIYAALGAFAAFLLSWGLTSLLTAHVPGGIATLPIVLAACFLGAAAGVLMVTISAERSMLVLAGAAAILISVPMARSQSVRELVVIAGVAIAGLFLILISSHLLERRCAS